MANEEPSDVVYYSTPGEYNNVLISLAFWAGKFPLTMHGIKYKWINRPLTLMIFFELSCSCILGIRGVVHQAGENSGPSCPPKRSQEAMLQILIIHERTIDNT